MAASRRRTRRMLASPGETFSLADLRAAVALVQTGPAPSIPSAPGRRRRPWLVLSHGVGAMRKYSIGAFLRDRDGPTKVLGRLREPLITPAEDERKGYVPNVVYFCGAMLHGQELIIPYAVSDFATRLATVAVDAVLAADGAGRPRAGSNECTMFGLDPIVSPADQA